MDNTNVAGGTSMQKNMTNNKDRMMNSEIKKIQKAKIRYDTFCKRRTTLFKKASEMCALTGAEIAVLRYSPGDRVFVFGHPSTDVLVNRYLNKNNKDATTNAGSSTQNSPSLPMNESNQHYEEVSSEEEAEKKRIETIPVSSGGLCWYEEHVDGMDVEELQRYLCLLEKLQKRVLMRVDELRTV